MKVYARVGRALALAASYVAASLMAMSVVLAHDVVDALTARRGVAQFPDLAAAGIYLPLAFAITLALGLVHALALRLLKWDAWYGDAWLAAVIGALAAGLGNDDGFRAENALLMPFWTASITAALTFRFCYHRLLRNPAGEESRP